MPYTAAQDIRRLEDFFFKKNLLSSIYSVASLRDRYCQDGTNKWDPKRRIIWCYFKQTWFNIKLFTDYWGFDNTISVTDQAYASKMKNACSHLGIISKHFVYFGWLAGSVKAELDELDDYNINDLGNWNVNTRCDVYSAKLPMKAMRVMAGHPDEKGSVFSTRSHQTFNDPATNNLSIYWKRNWIYWCSYQFYRLCFS